MDEREVLIERLRDAALELSELERTETDAGRPSPHVRAMNEKIEDLLDRLDPLAAIPPPPPSDALAPSGLAIVVGHTARSQGAAGLVPPFPVDTSATPLADNHEYAWNTDLAMRIKERAGRAGIRCDIFFRDGVGIVGAYANVRRWSPRATVELHFNAVRGGTARGSEVLYGHRDSKAWAEALQKELVAIYDRQGRADRGIVLRDGGGRGHDNVTQLHPSALIEPFFGDNRSDATLGVEKKDALADAILAAFARIAGLAPPETGTEPAVTVEPPPPTSADIPDVPLLRELFATYRGFTPTVPGLAAEVVERLKGVTLAQWIEESGWARSELALAHFNFAGMKAIAEVDAILRDVPATKVQYRAHDGIDTYLKFGSIRDFIRGYFMFLERSPYRGWHERAARSPHDFIRFIGRTWAQREGYASRVIDIERRLVRAGLVGSDGTLPGVPVPDAGDGGHAPGGGLVDAAKVRAQGATEDFLALVAALLAEPAFAALQPALVAQWGLESDWGRSDLARIHANFAGIEWSGLFGEMAAPVPHPADPARGRFCRFLSPRTFLRGYKHRLDNDPAFAGWAASAGDPASYAVFLGAAWRSTDPQYAAKITGIAGRIAAAGGGSPGTAADLGPVAGGTAVRGVVLQVKRLRAERRRRVGERTVSTYQLFVDGAPVSAISGMFLESRGPGDNSSTGVARHTRIKAGVYPLLTHSGARVDGVTKYRTIGFTADTGVGAMPRPSIRLGETSSRSGILIHPGDGFLWSVGCLNASKPLGDASDNMVYADSRTRLIQMLDAIRGALAGSFPTENNRRIRDAWVEVIGEPGPAGPDTLGAAEDVDRLGHARRELAVATAFLADSAAFGMGDALEGPDLVAVHDALAAQMYAGSLLGQPDDGSIDRLAAEGIDLARVRGEANETLWTPWALAVPAAEASGDDQREALTTRLRAIARRLREAGVPIDDTEGVHSAMVTAAVNDDVRAMEALVEEGASIDRFDGSGVTPLLAAAYSGAPEAVAFLLARGADPRLVVRDPARAIDALTESEFASPGDAAAACAAAGAVLADDDDARFEDYERVTALIWNALNQP